MKPEFEAQGFGILEQMEIAAACHPSTIPF